MRKARWWSKLACALAVSTALTSFAIPTETKAADTDEIMLGVFFTSEEDVTDTLYWSTNGVDFYELCEAYTDSTPNNASEAFSTQALKFGGKISTLHDPSIIYKNGYFYMISGYIENNKFRPCIGYSPDLVNWSWPKYVDVELASMPMGSEKYGANCDMVAPDFMVDSDGSIVMTASFGYYALFHGGNSLDDIMQPYLIRGTLEAPAEVDLVNKPHIAANMNFSKAVPINLPCMESGLVGCHNHIDGSFYKEGGYYYFCIKENGVSDEIYRIKNLDNVGDASAWELVSDDLITGYEGPSLTKFRNQYFMYVDRLNGFEGFTSAGVHVIKASTGTTGKLDQYTGWIDNNTKEIRTYDLNGNRRANRHGTVITVTGDAAAKVRAVAAGTRYSDTGITYNAADWTTDGWYKLEGYRDNGRGGKIVQYLYKNDKRLGVDPKNSEYFGIETKDPENGNDIFLEGKEMGKMATALNVYDSNGNLIKNAYENGDYQVYMPYDMDNYNAAGKEAYGTAQDTWCWKRYDYNGKRIVSSEYPFTVDGKTGANYHYDATTGAATIGRFDYDNGTFVVSCYMDPTTGIRVQDQTIHVNGKDLYFDKYGSFIAEKSSAGATVDDIPKINFRSPNAAARHQEPDETTDGAPSDNPNWQIEDGNVFWYENGIKQGTEGRGKEIYDSGSDGWYWLDSVLGGAVAKDKDVYQESKAGLNSDNLVVSKNGAIDLEASIGKWTSYDSEGMMVKGWKTVEGKGKYFFDYTYGAMAKGYDTIDGVEYYFNPTTGVLEREVAADIPKQGWKTIDGNDYWYENYQRMGYSHVGDSYRGKEIFDPDSNAWYWLDNVDGGKKATAKDVYQESEAGQWGDYEEDGTRYGKWVRYDANGHMVKGWCQGKDGDAKVISSPDDAEPGASVYYFDLVYGTMAKGDAEIDGQHYYFDPGSGVLQR